jgi:hypothetical protein
MQRVSTSLGHISTHVPMFIDWYNLAFTCPGTFLYRKNKIKKHLGPGPDFKLISS